MRRRAFFTTATSVLAASGLVDSNNAAAEVDSPRKPRPFALKYAPHFGMFANSAGKDLVDQMKFARDEGFTAWEDNAMKDRPVRQQERLARAMERLGIELGVISALRGIWGGVNFAGGDEPSRQAVLDSMRKAVEAAPRVNAKWLTVVPGMANPKLPHEFQMASCIELLRKCCDIVGPHGLVMVLEPLNPWRDHPGIFLRGGPMAFELCRAVDHPSCKILFDIYHQQITGGNLIATIDRCWSEIAYFQCADTPGRCEPGTGEINYPHVFQHLHTKGYRGVMGLEHGNSQPGAKGERAVIDAYRRVDPSA